MTAHNRPFWRRLAQAAAKHATSAAAAQNNVAAAGLSSSMRPLALEQRFMFDGAGAADAAADTAGALRHALMAESAPATSQPQEVVFVDSQVANLAELLAGLSGNAEVVILDASKDGLQQMADYLQGRSGLDAIHLLSHGADGKVQVGSLWLSSANLAEHNAALQSIGAALDANGDLLFYGCSVGASSEGQAFLDAVANITGADVAASVDATGAAALGGNWILEKNTGTIESKIPFNSDALDNYNGLLYLSDGTYTFSGTIGPNNSARSGFAIYSGNDGNFVISNGFTIDPGTSQLWSVGAQGAYDEANLIISVIGAQGTPFTFKDLQISLYPGQPSSTFVKLSLVTKDINGSTIGNYSISSNYSLASSQGIVSLSSILNANNTFSDVNVASVELSWKFAGDAPSNLNIESITLVDMQQQINEAPQVSLTATNPTYTENTSAVQLFSGATVSTGEAGQLVQQMTFTVSGVANGAAEKLVIDGTDVTLIHGTSLVTSNNGTVVTVSVTSGTASVTLSSAGLDVATAQTILNTMAYRNDSESPNTANRVVTLSTVSDNGGTDNGGIPTAAIGTSSTVTVVGINDAPTLAGGPYLLTGTAEDISSTGVQINTVLAGLTYSDPDSGALLGAAVTATTGNGTWQFSLNGVTGWTAFGTLTNSTALLLTGTTFVRYTPDSANGETATLTLRAWDQTSGTASSASTPRTGDTSIAGGSSAYSSGTATASLTVTNANDAPVLSAGSPTLPGLTDSQINDAGVLVSTLYSTNFTDVDNSAVKGIAITSLNAGNGTWQYSLDGTTWSNVGVVSVNSALLLRSTDHVRFVPNGVSGTTADFTFRAWDQTGITSGMQGTKAVASSAGGITPFSVGFNTASITVTAVNDAPTLTGSGGNLTWTEGNNTTSIPVVVDSGLTITDADGPYIASASARISNNYSSGNDSLELVSVAATMGNIIGTWDAGTGTLTLTSAGNLASLAQFQAALQAVTFTNLSDTPTVGTRTVEFKVNDGSLDSLSVSRNILISAVDDAPVITAPTSITVVEDVATVLSNISIDDPDSVNIVMTLSVTSGTLGAIGGSGVAVGGTATAMTLSGTIANVNAFISNNRVTYTTAANATADATLTVLVDTGSVGTDTKTITLAVTPVNDAPVVSVPVSLTVTEDVPGGVTNISFSDVDAGNASVTATFSVPSGVLRAVSGSGVTVDGSGTGTLTLSGSLSDINTFIAATRVSFQTALNSTDSLLLTVSINDNGNTGGAAQTDSKTVIINVTAVNDAPVNSVPGAQSTKQNTVLAFNTLKGNAISVSDPDAGSSNVIVILNSVNGTMSLTAAGGVTFVSGDGVDDTSMRMQGTLADLNTTLQSLTFKPTTGFLGNAQMSIQTNDMGFSGSGGAKTDFDLILITVVPANPAVTSVSAQGLDRAVKIGDEVLINMTWDQVVNVDLSNGSPTLLLETGLVDREAVYVSGSGSNTLVFKYTVQASDISADLDFQSTAALQMNGAVISNNSSDLAVLTLPTVGGADSLGGRSNIVVDGVLPAQPVLQLVSNEAGSAAVRVDALEPGAPWEYSLDGGQSWQAGQGNVVAIDSPGQYNVQVRQTNAVGNVSEAGVLSVNVAPLAVPPRAEWPVMGIYSGAGAGIWEAPLVPGLAPLGFDADAAVVPRGSGNVFLGSGYATSAASSFFSGGVVTDSGELSSGFLGSGGVGGSGVVATSALAGMFAPPAITTDRLVLLQPAEAVVVAAGRQVDWKVPPTMFAHSDPLASLQFALIQANGQPLPAWLAFDARTGQVSGEPPSGFKGELVLRLTARDNQGNVVSTIIKLKAADVGPVARAGVGEQLQRHAQLRAGQMAAQRLHL